MDSRNASPQGSWVARLLPLVMVAAVAAGFLLVRRAPGSLFGWAFGLLFGASLTWILVSVLWPARADRSCPRCGADALERLDPGTTHGVRCRACGFTDETQSSWLLAEEEGPLEDIVLEERRKRGPSKTPVDSLRSGD